MAFGLTNPTTFLLMPAGSFVVPMHSLAYVSGVMYQLCGIFSVNISRALVLLTYLITVMLLGITTHCHDGLRRP
jgi:hypothetical protein